MSSPRRSANEQWGRRAEWLCRLRLALTGYRLIAHRYASPVGEIDLIARRGTLLCFIEVKARPTLADGLAAVTARQRQRIERAALDFLARHRQFEAMQIRFDVMVVTHLWPSQVWPIHLTDAWRPSQ